MRHVVLSYRMTKTKLHAKKTAKAATTKAKARRAKAPKLAKGPNPAAQALGRLGGLARKRNLSPERASEIGRQAHAARYGLPWPRVAPADPAVVGK
jgi:hypothetical protein